MKLHLTILFSLLFSFCSNGSLLAQTIPKEELIFLVNREGSRFITDFRSLDEVEELVDPKIFYRVNRQQLVHLPFIESYRGDDTGKLNLRLRVIKTIDSVVSKEKAAEFKKWFD